MHLGKSSKIFNKISDVGPEFVLSSLGPVGKKLVDFFENFGSHPEMDSLIFDESDLLLCDVLDLAKHAQDMGMEFFKQYVPDIAQSLASDKLKSSKSPAKNGAYARLLRKPIRDQARKTRNIQTVGSDNFFKAFSSFYECIPSDFSSFSKDFFSFGECILDDAFNKFSDMSCDNLANLSRDLADRFHRPSNHFGYKKINMLDACMIVLKSNGIKSKIQKHESPKLIAVPLHYVGSLTNHVEKSIDNCEHCGQLFFDSVFDNYLVILPCLGRSNYRDVDFAHELESCKAAVLGERNGECYFVCEWK